MQCFAGWFRLPRVFFYVYVLKHIGHVVDTDAVILNNGFVGLLGTHERGVQPSRETRQILVAAALDGSVAPCCCLACSWPHVCGWCMVTWLPHGCLHPAGQRDCPYKTSYSCLGTTGTNLLVAKNNCAAKLRTMCAKDSQVNPHCSQ